MIPPVSLADMKSGPTSENKGTHKEAVLSLVRLNAREMHSQFAGSRRQTEIQLS